MLPFQPHILLITIGHTGKGILRQRCEVLAQRTTFLETYPRIQTAVSKISVVFRMLISIFIPQKVRTKLCVHPFLRPGPLRAFPCLMRMQELRGWRKSAVRIQEVTATNHELYTLAETVNALNFCLHWTQSLGIGKRCFMKHLRSSSPLGA